MAVIDNVPHPVYTRKISLVSASLVFGQNKKFVLYFSITSPHAVLCHIEYMFFTQEIACEEQ